MSDAMAETETPAKEDEEDEEDDAVAFPTPFAIPFPEAFPEAPAAEEGCVDVDAFPLAVAFPLALAVALPAAFGADFAAALAGVVPGGAVEDELLDPPPTSSSLSLSISRR